MFNHLDATDEVKNKNVKGLRLLYQFGLKRAAVKRLKNPCGITV